MIIIRCVIISTSIAARGDEDAVDVQLADERAALQLLVQIHKLMVIMHGNNTTYSNIK